MAGEEWARRIVQKELRRAVALNDDGSAPGMYDLRIGPADAPEVAIECVGAVDKQFTETWNVGPAKGPLHAPVRGDWMVVIAQSAHVGRAKKALPRLIGELEQQGIISLIVDHRLCWRDEHLFGELDSLGITQVYCHRPQGRGMVHLGMDGRGGATDEKGSAVPGWVGDFLRDPIRGDVLHKLHRSRADGRHAFILVALAGAPWPVESYLAGEISHLPCEAPDLPPPVTGVWVVWTFGEGGLRWNGATWVRFTARGEGIDR